MSIITRNKKMYETLTEFERALARFGDKCALIAGMEIADKISPEEAYQQIKDMYKELKKLRKKEKDTWEIETE
jgi:transcription elongation factor Elf1